MRRALPLAGLLLLAACRQPAPGDHPNIAFGRDACARCGMLVTEARFAAGFVDGNGGTVAFDDVGELLAAAAEPGSVRGAFVADAAGGGWVRAEDAFYARVPGLATPMGTGAAAFASREAAESFARPRGGSVFDWTGSREMAQRQAEARRRPQPAAGESE